MISAMGRERDARTARKGYLPRQDKVRSLQRRLYRSAKADHRRVFHQLYEHISRTDVLERAWVDVRNNGGAAGVDGESIKQFGERREENLKELAREIREESYRPRPVRRVLIPKPNGESRPLGIPTVRDRVVQTAIKLVVEPVFEARFYEHSYGFRPKRSAHDALNLATRFINAGYRHVLDVDIRRYFDSVPHAQLLRSVRRQISDTRVLRLMKRLLKSPIQEPSGEIVRCCRGVPQGGPLSPLLANVYLSAVDFWFLKNTRYKDAVWIRFADDAVLVSRKPLGRLR